MTSRAPIIWVDTDVALGAPRGDVDDGFALAYLLAAARDGQVELAGISTVDGNTSAERAEECARALSATARWTGRVVRGADPGLARLPAGARIVALGPLGNVDAAIRLDPGLAERVSLSVVGGNLSSAGLVPPLWPYDFNLARDRAAAARVLAAPWREILLFPLDVVRSIRADRNRLDEVGRTGPLGALVAEGSLRWIRRARRLRLSDSFPVFDLPAALHAAGTLPGEISPALPGRARRRLPSRPAGPISCLTSLSPSAAWTVFLDGLAGRRFRNTTPARGVLSLPHETTNR